ncbi:hypothetical protein [Streptomyces olivochromogenes]|uniref:hypothetical protein n=1 Tax=Streptomyces olivochromogenes TaxID=1963 RepID=UPI001F213A47|nr:hypothetical protein [Streptomyces olivochromogenes]
MLVARPVEEAEGPYDAGYLPRLQMSFHPVEGPVTEPVAKLGGDPVWLAEPCWPVHPETQEPLDFIGQFPVPAEPGEEQRMAYLFLSYDDYESGGADAEDGEAVLLIQPGGRIPALAAIGPAGTKGRSLWRFGPDDEQVPVGRGRGAVALLLLPHGHRQQPRVLPELRPWRRLRLPQPGPS